MSFLLLYKCLQLGYSKEIAPKDYIALVSRHNEVAYTYATMS